MEKDIANLKASLTLAVGCLESLKILLEKKEGGEERINHINQIIDSTLSNVRDLVD
jgi:hypothetical protein